MDKTSEHVLGIYVRHMYIIGCGLTGIRVQDLPEDVRDYYSLYVSYRDELRSKYYVPNLDYNVCRLKHPFPKGTCYNYYLSSLFYVTAVEVSIFEGPMSMEKIQMLHKTVISALYIAVKDVTNILHPTALRIIELYTNPINIAMGSLESLQCLSKKSNKDAKLYMNNTKESDQALLFLKSLCSTRDPSKQR